MTTLAPGTRVRVLPDDLEESGVHLIFGGLCGVVEENDWLRGDFVVVRFDTPPLHLFPSSYSAFFNDDELEVIDDDTA